MSAVDSSQETFDWSSSEPPRDVDPSAPIREGDRLGDFVVRQRIGEGGMGTVWEAEQRHPRRRVALKTIPPDRVSERARQRFRFEAQAMGALLHPGIPQIYAAGDDGGRLYLAMERVHGITLDTWALREKPTPRRLCELLIRICEAVQHAHLRGIVHRDLKPSNILVTDAGEPKVLDFGIAQALGSTSKTRISGTPAYMSPEQLTGAPLDVRTDVWSLGALAYELFSGRLAVDVTGMDSRQVLWAVTSNPIEPLGRIDRRLAGDIEAIVARALERDVDTRYASAQALADDLRRHLRHLPVRARTRTLPYRTGRWLRRNVGLTLTAATVFVSLSVGLGVALSAYWGAQGAWEAEARQRQAVEAALSRAEEERARAKASTEFLGELMAVAHPDQSPGTEPTITDALNHARTLLDEGALADQPAVEVEVRTVLAYVFWGMSRKEDADAMLEAALGLREVAGPTDAGIDATLSLADRRRGRDDARAVELLAMGESDLRALHPDPHELWAGYHHVAGRVHRAAGRYDRSEASFREALAVRDVVGEGEDPTATWNQLAHTLKAVGRLDEAQALYERALERDRQQWGDHHPQIATDLVNLGRTAALAGREDGVRMVNQALEMRRELLGEDHRRTTNARLALVELLLDRGRVDQAAPLFEEAWASALRDDGHDPTSGRWLLLRARIDLAKRDGTRAASDARAAVDWYAAEMGDAHPFTQEARIVLAEALAHDEPDAAREVLVEALGHLEATVGPQAPATLRARTLLPE